jgi:hypothetical protein
LNAKELDEVQERYKQNALKKGDVARLLGYIRQLKSTLEKQREEIKLLRVPNRKRPRTAYDKICGDKNRYSGPHKAWDAVYRLEAAQPGLRLYVYECPVCRGYHLTKNPGG